MQKKILILCNSNPDADPRPNRMIRFLKDDYQVTVAGRNEVRIESVQSIGFFDSHVGPSWPPAGTQEPIHSNTFRRFVVLMGRTTSKWFMRFWNLPKVLMGRLARTVKLSLGQYENIAWSQLGNAKAIQGQLAAQNYDLVISHDISLMPLVRNITSGKTTKIILDAREFYPKNFDDQRQWRLTVKPVNVYLCKTYLPICNKVTTVSKGLARAYKQEFGIDPDVIMSLPDYRDLAPSPVNPERIRIVHHGYAGYSRRTEVMIEMMDYVDECFSLDLMLLVRGDAYYRKIIAMAKQRKNVRVIPPVRMQEIVPFTNQYDIGLFLCPPTNFNLTYALPNKFFEFIQARLAVAIGPGIEMKEIVEQYDCGIVSRDFDPRSLANELNNLTPERIMEYKQKADVAARHLNADVNRKKILSMVQGLLAE